MKAVVTLSHLSLSHLHMEYFFYRLRSVKQTLRLRRNTAYHSSAADSFINDSTACSHPASLYEKQRLVDKPVTWHNEIVHGVHLLRALWLAQLFHVALYKRVYLTSKEKNTQWQRHGSQLCAYNGVFWVKPLPCCVVLWPVCMLQIGWGADTEYCCLAAELQMMGAFSAASLFSFTMILVLFTVF